MSNKPIAAPEFSEPVVSRHEGLQVTYTVDWTRKGRAQQTMVADSLIDQWIADLNELERLRTANALISWIDGACVDEMPHMDIRAAINRYRGVD